ncbi:hypothetical protein [Tritonibacter mobilis]|uniref:hypothetical protein n=1 Tax=Tritonibacter mobilis TaxID=379347 RepID=UPI000806D56D|nr:hypothetical protein [Tritonibacter mobilis]
MTDLVSRLRLTAEIAPAGTKTTRLAPGARRLLNEAAAEIVRLRENEKFLRDCLADRGMSATKQLSN